MLKQLRKNQAVNKLVRNLIQNFGNRSETFYKKLSNKWRTSGEINCNFESLEFKMYNECDDGLVGYFFYNNLEFPENQDLKLFRSLAKSSNVIIDIGANTGLFSILSSKANPGSKIYSIEPYLTNYNRLVKNIQLNNFQNIEPLNIALGEKVGSVNFSIPESGTISDVSSVNGEFSKHIYPNLKWKEIVVPLSTLDQLALKIGEKINLIKCDVETYEMNVFKGALNTLKNDKPTILFESFLDEERKIFFNNILQENGYHVYLVLKDGIVRLENGFNTNDTGLNYLISPKRSSETFIGFKRLDLNPQEVML
jgi:methyltransferase, FkbM family